MGGRYPPGAIKMLIVEDQDVMRLSLREFLQAAFPAMTIREAGNARQALELCREHKPRLVLMDVQLPDGNGIALTAQIRALLPGTAVIVVSQNTARTYGERALAAGAFAYITKDKVSRELLPAIAGAFARTPEVRQNDRAPG